MRDPIVDEGLESIKVTRLDIVVFFVAFAGGTGLYLMLHLLQVKQLIVTGTIIATMIAYALAIMKVPRLRVRFDQAGDNAYYLGLLFTLVSMAVALWEF